MKAIFALAVLALAASASAQTINITAVEDLLSGYTGGSDGLPSDSYLTSLASTLASGFVKSVGGVINNVTTFVENPKSYKDFLDTLEDEFCTAAYINASKSVPAKIVGPEIDLIFAGGACLLNETHFLEQHGDLTVDCIAPSVTVQILPATITSPYKSAVTFTDKECSISKTFGEESDNVVFVLDKGIFNVTGLVEKMTTGLTSVLGEFSSLTGDVVSSPTIAPILSAVNSATALLG